MSPPLGTPKELWGGQVQAPLHMPTSPTSSVMSANHRYQSIIRMPPLLRVVAWQVLCRRFA